VLSCKPKLLYPKTADYVDHVLLGPYHHTIPHFLQMIIDKKVTAIVMLTKLKETQKDPQNGKNYS
jgi:hypothetical protein